MTVAATVVLPFKSRTVLELTVLELSASLKAIVIDADVATFVVPLAGLMPLTVGGVVSAGGVTANVVKLEVNVWARALPAVSFTPLEPPRIERV